MVTNLYTKIAFTGWKILWTVLLLIIIIIKHYLAHKFKWHGKTLRNCRHWWTNLIQEPCKGFVWFAHCNNHVFHEEGLLTQFVHKQLIPLAELWATQDVYVYCRWAVVMDLNFFIFLILNNSEMVKAVTPAFLSI